MWNPTKKMVAAAILGLSLSPAAVAQPSAAEDWRRYADAMREWSKQWKEWAAEYKLAQQRSPAPPAAPVPPMPAMPGIFAIAGGNRSFLGVNVVEIDSSRAAALKLKDEAGVEITNVEPESPAEKAGLKKGDVVLEYQGQRVEGTEQFIRLVRETPAGRQVKMLVRKDGGATSTVNATVATRKLRAVKAPEMPEAPRVEMWIPDTPRAYMGLRSARFGIEAEKVDGQLADYFGVKEGVLVRAVSKGSAAEKSGLRAGDVITKVDQTAIDSTRELSDVLRAGGKEKKTVAITVTREKRELTVNAALDEEFGGGGGGGVSPARAVVRREEYRF
ncbi:MAG: PDZ domain-containing protein [Bryobacterales bacterium]|nr:PDZ domain-containing protein [Bryobacterales bacterium]